jgi:hypothetical protein
MRTTSRELAPPLALARRPRDAYARTASAGSATLVATLAICAAAGFIGVICASIAASALVALCFSATRFARVQRYIDRESVRHARARRESERRRSLGSAPTSRRDQYDVLLAIVDDIECLDAVEASRLELHDLLDHFVRLSVGHQRCLDSSGIFVDSYDASAIPPSAATYRHEIAERRLRLRDESTKQLSRIADELACIDGFIRLVAQRVAVVNLHSVWGADSEIDRRLIELDDVEAALGEICA